MSYLKILVWPGGGLIGAILWMLSIVTVAIIVEHFLSIRRANIIPDSVRSRILELFKAREYLSAINLTAEEPSFLSSVVHAALKESPHGHPAMERAMEEATEEQATKLFRHIEWLNLIGNISPMLGLLGTVWGMINAFFEIVRAGGIPNPAMFARPIGIALVTTLLGLAVAIPALSVYSIMRNRIDVLSSEVMLVGQDLITSFHSDEPK
jgi:biopolymer transport protein ExbB